MYSHLQFFQGCQPFSLNRHFHLLKILNTDEQELNSLDYQVLLSFRQTRTDFFPMKTSLSIDSMGSIEEEEE